MIGYGMVDVAYLLTSSVDAVVLPALDIIMQHYHTHLMNRLEERGIDEERYIGYNKELMMRHLYIALGDWVRFMKGWGMWGNYEWAQHIAKSILLS